MSGLCAPIVDLEAEGCAKGVWIICGFSDHGDENPTISYNGTRKTNLGQNTEGVGGCSPSAHRAPHRARRADGIIDNN